MDALPLVCQAPLHGRFVRLEPLLTTHVEALEKQFKPEHSKYFPMVIPSARDYFESLVVRKDLGLSQFYVIIDQTSHAPIGCTGLYSFHPGFRRLEIGGSWLSFDFQKTAANAEAKLLMLQRAFDEMHCVRAEFKTDSLNLQSQNALEKLGIVREGVLRNHMIVTDGRRRHSVYYSVIVEDWPQTRLQILARIDLKSRR